MQIWRFKYIIAAFTLFIMFNSLVSEKVSVRQSCIHSSLSDQSETTILYGA